MTPLRKTNSVSSTHQSLAKKTKAQEHVSALKSDLNLFSRLYVACQVRDGNLDYFFAHENQSCPPSLSDAGKLRPGTKSDIVHCLEESVKDEEYVDHNADAIVLDGPAIVHMLKPGSAKTFREYAQDVFIPYIEMQLAKSQRVDIVWDTYRRDSLKEQTRDRRGKGMRRRVEPQNKIPKSWGEFLRVDENKTELFAFLSREVISIPTNKQIISTLNDEVVCRQPILIEGISPCSHEEADTRIMLHVAHAARQHNTVLIRTVDSDVVVLAVYVFAQLTSSLSTLWVAYGTGKHFRLLAVHNIYTAIGREKSLTLPFFHAMTGCDTVSAFAGRGKRTAWEIWHLYPEVTTAFAKLMNQPDITEVEDAMDTLERFVILLYDKTSSKNHVNDARLDLFTRKGRDVNGIPPSQGALLQHVRRAAYQAGVCWSQSLLPVMNLPR